MANLTGTSGNDTLTGSSGSDSLTGAGGNDLLQGLGAADVLIGDGGDTGGGGGGGGGLSLSATAQAYLSAGKSLSNGLGGEQGFGENVLNRQDDSPFYTIDVSSVFTGGLNFFGQNYTTIFLNNNGAINFEYGTSTYTPSDITGNTDNPIIAPFWSDIDTRETAGLATTPGGNSTGTNQVFYDLDTANHVFTVTWNDVGYYSHHVDQLNAFQLQLVDRGGGDFDIIFRYEAINWATPGSTIARAGYSAGNGVNFFELPQAGILDQMLALDTTSGNTGRDGVWTFEVRSGNVSSPGNDTLDGGSGDDTLDGGGGVDVALFTGSSAAYTVTRLGSTTYRVVGPDGNDTLQNVEMAQFGAGAPVPLSDLLPPVHLTATGNLPLDMTHDFDLGFDALQQFIPIAAYLESDQIRLALQNGGEVIGRATSIALNFISNAAAGPEGPQQVAHSLSYTATGTFAPAYNLARSAMTAAGATVGGAPLTGAELLGAGLQLQAGAAQIDLSQIMFTGLTSVVDGQPHYAITDIGLTAAEAAPFFLPALVPGGTIDIGGIIDQVGERRSVITGSTGNDILVSLGGNDTVDGGGGIDTILLPSNAGDADVNTAGGQSTISGDFGSVVVSNVEGANFSDQTEVLSGTFPVLSIADVVVSEGQAGTTNAVFSASLSGPAPAGGVTAAVLVSGVGDHPATAGVDFTVPAGLVTIPAGATSANITVPILGDASIEPDETFQVMLANVANAIQGVNTAAIGTIDNDDGNPLIGDGGANLLNGTPAADNLVGAGGNDTLYGQEASDLIDGGDGDDVIVDDAVGGGPIGNDQILAGAGADVIYILGGSDTVDGGDGADVIAVYSGSNQLIDGGAGGDTISLVVGDGTVSGGEGNDTIAVYGGQRIASGNAGDEVIWLIAGQCTADGGSGNDLFISLGVQTQTISGGSGNDVYLAGPGADIFDYDNGFGPYDTIYGFSRASGDKIRLAPNINGTGITTPQEALVDAFPTVLEGQPSTIIVLATSAIGIVGVSQLLASDFLIG